MRRQRETNFCACVVVIVINISSGLTVYYIEILQPIMVALFCRILALQPAFVQLIYAA